jgi:hypothetical protein
MNECNEHKKEQCLKQEKFSSKSDFVSSIKFLLKNQENVTNRVNTDQLESTLDEIMNISHQLPRSIKSEIQLAVLKTREEIIDWLVIVCKKLDQCDMTYFVTIEILDKILESYNFELKEEDVLLISIVSLFIASKYEERNSIPMDLIIKGIGKKRFTKKDIIATEYIILRNLKFIVPKSYFIDFVSITMHKMRNKAEDTLSSECTELIFKLSKIIYKLILHDYATIHYENRILIFSAIVYYSSRYFVDHDISQVKTLGNEIEKFFPSLIKLFEKIGGNVSELIKTQIMIHEKKAQFFSANNDKCRYLKSEEFLEFESILNSKN